ncbi:response regulator transcription factor [Anaerovorax odorimutans]|uniref:response regulator transcription factor n=1 Tax=Anaerovorax odorimutans TaxID=109327 RepID=UPI00041DB6A9|nr:response regulator transcription factor [Anaerovorax odorimutans]
MPGEKILIVDDEKPINNLISSYLTKEGFVPFSAFNGEEAMNIVNSENPDLILMDIMLPDIEGTDLCLEIRKTNNAPILFLSCKSEEMDKIIALSVGGDDYITKPFLPGELIARIKAHIRRQKSIQKEEAKEKEAKEKIYEFPGLTVNMSTHDVTIDKKLVSLTAKEFHILKILIENPKQIFSADQIFELTWKTNCLEGDSRTVMVYISTLRKKLEINPINPKYIINIRGVGYKFNHNILPDKK